jgi:hypothetical protein
MDIRGLESREYGWVSSGGGYKAYERTPSRYRGLLVGLPFVDAVLANRRNQRLN